VTGGCPSVLALSDAYREDRLSREERRDFRAHLVSCDECRRMAMARDPAILFALAPAPVDEGGEAEARAILENVRAALAIRDTSRKLDHSVSARHGRRTAAAVGAAALLALTFSAPLTRRRPLPVSTAAAAPRGIRNAATKIVRPGADEPSLPSSATIYEWNPGAASPDDPKIVWIVDRSLDL
jgi:putative zinc finger protein